MDNQNKIVEQTGFLYKQKDTDFITGASPITGTEVNTSGNWEQYIPVAEKQYKDATFDTMSCTTFSALNIFETWVSFFLKNKILSSSQIETLNDLGFFNTNQFNCSDRFTAIMSGTMRNGNYFQSVIDSIRKDGLLPESDLPFGGNSWDEYHNKALITDAMKAKAKKILDIFEIAYEWTPVSTIGIQLKQCPIQGAIPAQATHAVAVISEDKYFDTYAPYIKTIDGIQYAMKIIVMVKKPTEKPKTYKYFSEKEVSDYKVRPELFEILDKMRELAGTPFIITSGYRTPAQNKKVGGAPNSAHLRALAVDLLCTNNVKRTKMLKGILGCGIPVFLEIANNHLHIDIDTSIHTMGDTIIINDD